MAKASYIFGWKYGGDGYQLYIQCREKDTPGDDVPPGHDKCNWWVTNKTEKATRFKSIDTCLAYFRKINCGEADAEARIRSGRVQFFQDTPMGPVQVKPVPPQLSLFDDQQSTPPAEVPVAGLTIKDFYRKGFSPDEAKILLAGFTLVRYTRDLKRIELVHPETRTGQWLELAESPYASYAAAEKTLAEVLTHPKRIQISDSGNTFDYKSIHKLTATGFDFYRSEGNIPGHGTPRIKCYSKNWGNWQKFASGEECKSAWDELMKDPKALKG